MNTKEKKPQHTEAFTGSGSGFRSGYVVIAGRPNVGKSTFLNAVLGEKIAIVTPAPQTTRNCILGIKTLDHAQIVFIDTPGIHEPRHALGKRMVQEARSSLRDADIVLLMVTPKSPRHEDLEILDMLRKREKVSLIINKTDTIQKPLLLPLIDSYRKLFPFRDIFPVTALRGEGVSSVIAGIIPYLPEGPALFPDDMVTDRPERFILAEIIREKMMLHTGQEVPHAVAVEIVQWQERNEDGLYVSANLFVEREGQKGIIIGNKGSRLKAIGTSARKEGEQMLGKKLYLDLWVKVKKDWRSDDRILGELGYR